MLLIDVADTSAAVAATASRRAKVTLLAACLQRADRSDVEVVVSYLAGELRQRRTGLGPAALRTLPPPAQRPTLPVAAVDAEFAALAALSGPGSTGARRERFGALMAQATVAEQHLVAGLVAGELRQGALDAVLAEAVAEAAGVPAAEVRRAVTVAGSLVAVARELLTDGPDALARFRLRLGTPLRPMLAAPSTGIDDALTRLGRAALEWKIDGVRVQVHRRGGEVQVFTRTLDDITPRVPEIVDAVLAMPAEQLVLDGEAIALDDTGAPLPFQRTASRVGRKGDAAAARVEVPLSVFFFDCLHLDGRDLIGVGAPERWTALTSVVPDAMRVPRTITDDLAAAEAFYRDALAHRHEGVVAKSLDVAYEAGRRGSGWLKVKPRHTLDMVVLAAEWGHGRRQGWLSNLHLGLRDPDGVVGEPDGLVMMGKTFKGLTDAMLSWQTERLLSLADGPTDGWVVTVAPELVVEIAFDGVQTSTRYPGGMALRFARVLRHRPDKPAADADTLAAVTALHRLG